MGRPNDASIALGAGREFDVVRALAEVWGARARGLGDDAAVVDVPPGERLVVSTDLSAEDVHFREAWLAPDEIAYRAAVSALSDLAAMAATPLGLLLSLQLPDRWASRVGQLAHGILRALERADTVVLGGDVTGGLQLSLGITVLGACRNPISRLGAAKGDALYVTGTLGGPGDAVRAWYAGETPRAWSRARFAAPVARLREALWLAERGATAMIDISDGLSSELGHLAAANRVALHVDVERVPVGEGIDQLAATGSGEEYELLVAAPAINEMAFFQQFGVPLTCIGSVGEQGSAVVHAYRSDPSRCVDLAPGHDHFSR